MKQKLLANEVVSVHFDTVFCHVNLFLAFDIVYLCTMLPTYPAELLYLVDLDEYRKFRNNWKKKKNTTEIIFAHFMHIFTEINSEYAFCRKQ